MTADPTFLAGETLPASKLVALSPDPTAFTPSWTNVTLGTLPTSEGFACQIGRLVFFGARFVLGTGGSVSGTISLDLPVEADSNFNALTVGQAFASDSGGNPRYAGTFQISTTEVTRIIGDGTAIGWNATQPLTWNAGDQLKLAGWYVAAEA